MDEHHVNKENNLHYNIPKYIMTLGSHCSLQVLKGAKDEGFKTLLICEEKRLSLYKRFKFIDKFIVLDDFKDVLNNDFQKKINR
jgi:5-formaminoimidazole-4-carboxamide-1-(beta)-D-ribofuranosyl 5'-monophosphate synthetase